MKNLNYILKNIKSYDINKIINLKNLLTNIKSFKYDIKSFKYDINKIKSFALWNIIGINIFCFYPLIKHGKYREETFRHRGSYNPAVDQLFPATILTLGSWHTSKKIWNCETQDWFNKLNPEIKQYMLKWNRFAAFGIITLSCSYMFTNIYSLYVQDRALNYFNKTSVNVSPDAVDLKEQN